MTRKRKRTERGRQLETETQRGTERQTHRQRLRQAEKKRETKEMTGKIHFVAIKKTTTTGIGFPAK